MIKTLSLCFLLFAGACFLSPTAGAQNKDKSKTKAEKPFVIHEKTSKISRADIRKDTRGTESIIQIDAIRASGGAATLTKATLPPAEINSVVLVSGNYNLTRELAKTSRGMSMQLLDVVFPCRVRLNVSDQVFEFEIKEAGFWKVSLALLD